MERYELQPLVDQAIEQIANTTHDVISWTRLIEGAQVMRANEDAPIYQHLRQAFSNILTKDILPTAYAPQGHSKTIQLNGHSLDVTVVHREMELEKITGVDVFYNLQGWKVLAFQHKKRNKQGVFDFSTEDKKQRDKIKQLCDNCKLPRKHKNDDGFIRPFCASVYVIADSSSAERHVVSACKIEQYRSYYRNNMEKILNQLPLPSDLETVDRMFLQCVLGRRLVEEKDKSSLASIEDAFLTKPDLVFKATLTRN